MAIEYLLVLSAMLSVPLAISFHPRLSIYQNKKALFISIAVPVILFGMWDIIAVDRGHWDFNPEFVLGVTILGLPIEEWLFFIILPFVSVFTWEAVNSFWRARK